MSNLRDRLKKISAEKRPAQAEAVPKRKSCAMRVQFMDAPKLVLEPEIMQLMIGKDYPEISLRPEECIFLDTETTGLSRGVGTIAFEVGVGEIMGNQIKITQMWMRDYDEEEDMLLRLNDLFAGKKAIVSFNGKSYDVPLLLNRFTLNRIHVSWRDLPQIDLLYPARRLYKLRLKQCNLGHLEEIVLGLYREGDIPGSEIPALWAEYLKTREEDLLLRVFDHNQQDVQSMAYLLQKLYQAHQTPAEQMHMEDVFSLGRVYDKAGRFDVAERCYVSVEAGSCRTLAGKALTRIYRKENRTQEAIKLLENMIAAGNGGIFPYVELAKLYEHRLKDPKQALYYTDQALSKTMESEQIQELMYRRKRLAEKSKRKA